MRVQAADVRDAYDAAGQLPYLGPLFWYDLQDATSDQTHVPPTRDPRVSRITG